MSKFIRLASVAELPAEGEVREYECAGRAYCVSRVNGQLSALDNICLHEEGPLGQGTIEDGKLVCPWHAWQYDPLTGKLAHAPDQGVAVYALKIEGDDVLVSTEPVE